MYWALNYENSKSPARVNHASVSVGKFIFLFGGYCESRNGSEMPELKEPTPIDCFEFDTSTLRWSKRPVPDKDSPQYEQTPYFRYGHTCVNYNNSVILWGGRADWNNSFQACNTVYSYDPRNHLWSKIEATNAAPKGRDGHTACVVKNSMLIFGGLILDLLTEFSNELFEFNFITRNWTQIDTRPETRPSCREFHTASVVGETMYVFGGRRDVGETRFTGESIYLNDMHAFDTTTRQWNKITYKQPQPPQQQQQQQQQQALQQSEAATAMTQTATQTGPSERRSHSAVVLGKKLLVFGGVQENIGKHFNDMFEFDTETSEWREVRACGMRPQPRRRHSCHVFDGQMFVFSGSGPEVYYCNNHDAANYEDENDGHDNLSPKMQRHQAHGHQFYNDLFGQKDTNSLAPPQTMSYWSSLNHHHHQQQQQAVQSSDQSRNPFVIVRSGLVPLRISSHHHHLTNRIESFQFLGRSPVRQHQQFEYTRVMNEIETLVDGQRRNRDEEMDDVYDSRIVNASASTRPTTLSDLHVMQLKVPSLKFMATFSVIDMNLDYSELPLELIKNLNNLSASKIVTAKKKQNGKIQATKLF